MDAPVLVTISYITDLYFSLNDNIVCKECCTKDEVMSVIKECFENCLHVCQRGKTYCQEIIMYITCKSNLELFNVMLESI